MDTTTASLPSFSTFEGNLYALCRADSTYIHRKANNLTREELLSGLYPNIFIDEPGINHGGLHHYVYPWRNSGRMIAIENALRKTHEWFLLYQQLANKYYLPIYQTYLNDLCKNSQPETTQNVKISTQFILDYFNAAQYFLLAATRRRYPKIEAFCKRYFSMECYKYFADIQRYYQIIDLHAQYADFLPYKLLIDFSKGAVPTSKRKWAAQIDNICLREDWVEFINCLVKSNVEVRVLHRGLRGLLEHSLFWFTSKADNHPNLAYLELLIELSIEKLHGMRVLTAEDFEHINKFRATLDEPDRLLVSKQYKMGENNSKIVTVNEIRIGKQVGKKKEGKFDRSVYYTIVSWASYNKTIPEGQEEDIFEEIDPSLKESREASRYLLWSAPNEALIEMKYTGFKVIHPGRFLGLPKIHFVDVEGKFGLVEKLKLQWCSPEWQEFKAKEMNWLDPVVELVKAIFSQRKLLDPLKPKYLMFNDAGELCTVKLTSWNPDYKIDRLEKFIYEVVSHDPKHFKAVIEQSKMNEGEEERILQKAVTQAFYPVQFAQIKNQIRLKDDFDEEVKDRLTKSVDSLQAEFIKLRKACIDKIEQTHSPLSLKEKQRIECLLIDQYKASGAIAFLWPDLETKVIKALI